jgi:dihydrofolate reductase
MSRVLWHTTMSLDGFIAGPDHSMDWMSGTSLFGGEIGRQCVQGGLVDELYVHVAPVLLGDGVRLFEAPGGEPVRLARIHEGDATRAADLRYRLI